MIKAKSPNPHQIAMYGHIARALQKFIADKGWKPADLNRAMGFESSHSIGYQWINGKAGVGKQYRAKLSKLTGIPQSELETGAPGKALATMPLPSLGASPVARAKSANDILGFTVASDGQARIRLDVSLPMHLATPLLRMLLDAGLVFSKDGVDENGN